MKKEKIIQKSLLSICIICLSLFLISSLFAQQTGQLPGQAMSIEEMGKVLGICYPECLFWEMECGCQPSNAGDSCESSTDCFWTDWIHDCDVGGNRYTCRGTGNEVDDCSDWESYVDCGDRSECLFHDSDCVNGKCKPNSCSGCVHIPFVNCGGYYTCEDV